MAKEWSKQVFSQNLRKYIADSKITQKELADFVGVTAPTLNEWVSGKKFPRIDKVQKLADYFGILKSDLIEERLESSPEEKPVTKDGLTENQRKLIDFAEQLSDDQAEKVLRLMQSILAFDE